MPGGHGHNYGDAIVDGWAAVIPPDGWTLSDTDRLKLEMEAAQAKNGPDY